MTRMEFPDSVSHRYPVKHTAYLWELTLGVHTFLNNLNSAVSCRHHTFASQHPKAHCLETSFERVIGDFDERIDQSFQAFDLGCFFCSEVFLLVRIAFGKKAVDISGV